MPERRTIKLGAASLFSLVGAALLAAFAVLAWHRSAVAGAVVGALAVLVALGGAAALLRTSLRERTGR